MFDFGTVGFRKLEKKDLEPLLELKHETWTVTHHVTICSIEDQIRWFEGLNSDIHNPRNLVLMCYGNNALDGQSPNFCKPVGVFKVFSADYINRTADVGWDIFSRYRQQGWGKKMVCAGVKFCFNILGLQRLSAEILEENDASIKCAYAAGFSQEGLKRRSVCKQGYFHNTCLFGVLAELQETRGC